MNAWQTLNPLTKLSVIHKRKHSRRLLHCLLKSPPELTKVPSLFSNLFFFFTIIIWIFFSQVLKKVNNGKEKRKNKLEIVRCKTCLNVKSIYICAYILAYICTDRYPIGSPKRISSSDATADGLVSITAFYVNRISEMREWFRISMNVL